MKNLYQLIDRLIEINIENGLLDSMDCVYTRNRILALYKEEEYKVCEKIEDDFYAVLDQMAELAVEKELIPNTLAHKDIFSSHIMNIFLDKPSVINERFFEKYKEDPKKATEYFYNLSRKSNYVKVSRIEKNQSFRTQSKYGEIQITINLSKPEKDPKEIALAKTAVSNTYPTCLLCLENEGYEGTLTLPDRANHRMIRLNMNNKNWMMQYSPYLYYNEHCIVLSEHHSPMTICKDTFYQLLDFVKLFPHYFIGSNADLPIVGGSILSHEHYQGGRHTFPLDEAKQLFSFSIDKYPSIKASTLNWPLSTIELRSTSREDLAKCSNEILEFWKGYSNEALQIIASTDGTPHNTITPICKKEGEEYIMRLVLRNNRTDEANPMGIFHPHSDVHHIKKENIGLIEVMGLAILPGRLVKELNEVKAFVLGEASNVPEYHIPWAEELKLKYDSKVSIDKYVEQAVGDKFARVLEDAGVYKINEEGTQGFKKFVEDLLVTMN